MVQQVCEQLSVPDPRLQTVVTLGSAGRGRSKYTLVWQYRSYNIRGPHLLPLCEVSEEPNQLEQAKEAQ